jgi:hypothetical protein
VRSVVWTPSPFGLRVVKESDWGGEEGDGGGTTASSGAELGFGGCRGGGAVSAAGHR